MAIEQQDSHVRHVPRLGSDVLRIGSVGELGGRHTSSP
jgi:hypothetical protein